VVKWIAIEVSKKGVPRQPTRPCFYRVSESNEEWPTRDYLPGHLRHSEAHHPVSADLNARLKAGFAEATTFYTYPEHTPSRQYLFYGNGEISNAIELQANTGEAAMQTISYRTEGRLGYLTLNRPAKYNAIDEQMVMDLHQFWNERLYDDTVGVIILDGGEAKGFCAGLDMNTYGASIFKMNATDAYNAQAKLSRILLAMRRAPQPIICCVHGAAAGLGFSLVMASDVRILAEDARFSAAYINIGLGGADMASSYFLPRLIGAGRANEFLLTGTWMNAADAMNLGFASRLVAKDTLLETAKEIAEVMLSKDPLGLRMTKEAININLDAGGLEACLQLEDRNQIMILLAKQGRS
jgi:enoyl-CoA hydratase/carnithine racemase